MKKVIVILLLMGIRIGSMENIQEEEGIEAKFNKCRAGLKTCIEKARGWQKRALDAEANCEHYLSVVNKVGNMAVKGKGATTPLSLLQNLSLEMIFTGLQGLVELLDTQNITSSGQASFTLEAILNDGAQAGNYNEKIYKLYIAAFKDKGIQVANAKRTERERDLYRLFSDFDTVILTLKDLNSTPKDKTNIARYFDELITLRLYCAEYLKSEYLIIDGKQKSIKDFILDFAPLSMSRWNPFGWGNWYDRLHRTVGTLPTQPWGQGSNLIRQDARVTKHCADIVEFLQDMAKGASQDNNEGQNTAQIGQTRAALMIYLLTMNQLSVLVRWQLGSGTKWALRVPLIGALTLAVGAVARNVWEGSKKSTVSSMSPSDKPSSDYTWNFWGCKRW